MRGRAAFLLLVLALTPLAGALPLLGGTEAGPAQVRILVLDVAHEADVLRFLQEQGVEHRHWPNLHMVGAVVGADLERSLSGLPGVRSIHASKVARPYLSESAAYVGANVAWSTYRTTGQGVGIMVVDTGVDGTHPDVRLGENLVENVATRRQVNTGLISGYEEGVESTDLDGHGTHAASIAGGTGLADGGADRGKYRGIAHGAHLIGFQAGIRDLQTGDTGFDTPTVLEAFEYALANRDRFNIRVVTNSWGLNGEFDPQDPVNVATLELYRKGMVVVFAGGNEGSEGPGHMNMYSVAPWVLSVAAGNYFNQPTSFSSTGTTDPRKPWDHPDIMAPGLHITAARAAAAEGTVGNTLPTGGSTVRGSYYAAKSGTSMAAPHVAGAAALLLSKDATLSPDNVYDLLVASATPLPRVPIEEGGAGYLNIIRALQISDDVQGNRDAFLRGETKYSDRNLSADPLSVGLYGKSSGLGSIDTPIDQLARDLVGTWQGLVFLGGVAVLSGLAFRPARRRVP